MNSDELFDQLRALGARGFPLGERWISLSDLGAALVIASITVLAARFIERRTRAALSRNDPDREGSAGATARLAYYLLLMIGFTTAINSLGITLSALFAAGAIFAVGLGFGLQNVVQNFVSGIILLGERVIKPGDVLELEGEMVKVEKMGLRSTVARTLDEDQYIVPNQELAQNKVLNFTLSDRYFRLRVPVGVAYRSDLPTVFEVLKKAGAASSMIKHKPAKVLLTGFGASSIDFEVSVWVEDPWKKKQYASDLALQVWKHLKEAEIEIAFPQLDVHLDEAVIEALGARLEEGVRESVGEKKPVQPSADKHL